MDYRTNVADASTLKSYLVQHNWDHIKVLYGLLGPSDIRTRSILNSLIEQVDYFPHKVRLCKLDATMNPVVLEGQSPPFTTIEQLSCDLSKKAQMVVLWLCNDVNGASTNGSKYVPGDARSIALLDRFSHMVGSESEPEKEGEPSREAPSSRFKAGPFESPTPTDVENLIALLQSSDKWIRWVAVWALGQVKLTPDLKRLAEEPLKQAEGDEEQEVRTYAVEARRRLKTLDPDDKNVTNIGGLVKKDHSAAKWISKMLQSFGVARAGGITAQPLEELKERCRDLGKLEDTQNVLLEMSLNYYEDVRKQAQRSFRAALVAAGVGTLFFVAAAIGITADNQRATISLIAGTLIQVIAAINFYLYGKTAKQFSSFHVSLERMNRFLIGNNICGDVAPGDKKDDIRADLVKIIAEAPTLVAEGEFERPDSRRVGVEKQPRRPVAPKTNRLNKPSNTMGNSIS
jgi:hypothetical protein